MVMLLKVEAVIPVLPAVSCAQTMSVSNVLKDTIFQMKKIVFYASVGVPPVVMGQHARIAAVTTPSQTPTPTASPLLIAIPSVKPATSPQATLPAQLVSQASIAQETAVLPVLLPAKPALLKPVVVPAKKGIIFRVLPVRSVLRTVRNVRMALHATAASVTTATQSKCMPAFLNSATRPSV